MVRFLRWAYLQAYPKKCISMAMKRFYSASDSKYERYGETQYFACDPALVIDEEPLKFIVSVANDPKSLEYDHFKELGRFIGVDLKEDKIRAEVSLRLNADMDLVNNWSEWTRKALHLRACNRAPNIMVFSCAQLIAFVCAEP